MAHVDIPKGDLDGSADALSGPDYIVDVSSSISPTDIIYPCSKKQKRAEGQPLIYLICKMFTIGLFAYPWDLTQAVDVYGSVGTTELFPNMVDSAGNVLDNTGHYYMECSAKGLCDRKAGQCKCFPGYEGHACQRGTTFSSSITFSSRSACQ